MPPEVDFLPLIFDLDDLIEETASVDLDDFDAVEEGHGRSLSFDWSTLTFRIAASGDPVQVTGQAALTEDLVKELLTPRHKVPIYSGDYGAEFWQLEGEPLTVALPEVRRIIQEVCDNEPRISEIEELEVTPVSGGGIRAVLSVRDFQGELVRVPSIMVRYGA